MPKVAYITHSSPEVIEVVVGLAPPGYEVVSRHHSAPEEEKEEIARDADFIILHGGRLSEELLRNAGKLRLLQLLSAGYENVDLDLTAELGIPVANVGGANREGVAEMAVALMLAVYRRLVALDAGVRAGRWREGLSTGLDTFELGGKTVGIVGFGRIGQIVARRLQGFENTILCCDVVAYPEAERELGAKRVSLEQLLTESDIVTIHVPLLPENRGLIGERELSLMKPTAVLVNTARGPIIDERALISVLKERRIRGAGLDVFEQEPINEDNPLLQMENVVLAPHAAGGTYESWPRRAAFAYQNFQRVMEGKKPLSLVQE
jgi:phosphoglycerate dehydrogenase-like enzyme